MRLMRQIVRKSAIEMPIEIIDFLLYNFTSWTGQAPSVYHLISEVCRYIASGGLSDLVGKNTYLADSTEFHFAIIKNLSKVSCE